MYALIDWATAVLSVTAVALTILDVSLWRHR